MCFDRLFCPSPLLPPSPLPSVSLISFQLAAVLQNSSSSVPSAATAVPAAPSVPSEGPASTLSRGRTPTSPAVASAPHPPTHGSPLLATAADGATAATNDEPTAAQLLSASSATSAAQKHPHQPPFQRAVILLCPRYSINPHSHAVLSQRRTRCVCCISLMISQHGRTLT